MTIRKQGGTFLTVPCKIGDVVYEVDYICERITLLKITGINIHITHTAKIVYFDVITDGWIDILGLNDIGKTVFLTLPETQTKLKELLLQKKRK